MPQGKDPGPSIPGNLHVKVIRAQGLRPSAAGGVATPLVRLRTRAFANPQAPDSTVFETPVASSSDPNWDAEFLLPVTDANHSQLEITIWDASEASPLPAPFMGECILNLSKLVPYQGEVIMQDFDVKQGKQHKTDIHAAGKLTLQLKFTAASSPSVPMADQPKVMNGQQQRGAGEDSANTDGQFIMNIDVVEARNLGQPHSTEQTETYACVALLDDPGSMQTRHFHALSHDIGMGQDAITLRPQHRTKIVSCSGFPVWNDGFSLEESHSSILVVETAQARGNYDSPMVPLTGQPVLIMFTVHDHNLHCEGGQGFLGRVVLPQIMVGLTVDQWFVLQDYDGSELIGPSGDPSGLHVKISYGNASELTHLAKPSSMPHPTRAQPPSAFGQSVVVPNPPAQSVLELNAGMPIVPANITAELPHAESHIESTTMNPYVTPRNGAQTPDNFIRPSTPQIIQTFAGSQFAFYLEIVEAHNFPTSSGSEDLSRGVSKARVCISIVHDPVSIEKEHLFLIDHLMPDDELGSNLLRFSPQYTSSTAQACSSELGRLVWSDKFTLKKAQPSIQTIMDLNSRQQEIANEVVPLAGQTVLLLATVQEDAGGEMDGKAGLRGRVVIPHVRAGQHVDQWFMLLAQDGTQIKSSRGEDAAIRLRFAYGALRDQDEMPPGWEKKVDQTSGKVFYVNHKLKTFSWVPPPNKLPSQHSTPRGQGPLPPLLQSEQPVVKRQSLPTEELMEDKETILAQPKNHLSVQSSMPLHVDDSHWAAPAEATRNSGNRVRILVKEAKNLPKMDHLSLSNAYVCASIIGDSQGIDERARVRLQHDVSKNILRAGLRSSSLKIRPLDRTKTINRSLNPKWHSNIELGEAYANMEAIVALQKKGGGTEKGDECKRTALDGTPVMVLITVHHEVSGAEDTAIGKIFIPSLRPGKPLDEWCPILTNEGAQLVGGLSQPESSSMIHLSLTYETLKGAKNESFAEDAVRSDDQVQYEEREDGMGGQGLESPKGKDAKRNFGGQAHTTSAIAQGGNSEEKEKQRSMEAEEMVRRQRVYEQQKMIQQETDKRIRAQHQHMPSGEGREHDAGGNIVQPPSAVFPPKPSMHQAKLVTTVLQAKNLPRFDRTSEPSTFCELILDVCGHETPFARTITVLNSSEPVWDARFISGIDADPERIVNAEIKISLVEWDPHFGGQNRRLGYLRPLPLADLMTQGKTRSWLDVFTDDGHALGNANGPSAVCVELDYEPAHVRAIVDASPLLSPATNALFESRGKSVPDFSQTNREGGVGIVLSVGAHSEFVVDSLLEEGPGAVSNKIRIGDVLLDVDGHSIQEKTLADVQMMLAGDVHSPVTMTFSRPFGEADGEGPREIIVTLSRRMLKGQMSRGQSNENTKVKPMERLQLVPPRIEPAPMHDQAKLKNKDSGPDPTSEKDVHTLTSRSHAPKPELQPPPQSQPMESLSARAQPRAHSPTGLTQRQHDPLKHLKTEFEALMNDLYGNMDFYTKSDPEMAAALAWKRSLLYGKSHGKPLQSREEVLVSSNSSAADSAPVSVSCSPVRRGPPTPPK